jgi:hypothetical protein
MGFNHTEDYHQQQQLHHHHVEDSYSTFDHETSKNVFYEDTSDVEWSSLEDHESYQHHHSDHHQQQHHMVIDIKGGV